MYAACGAVSRADHEKIQADLEAANEAQKEVKEDLKKETKSRKDAEKKAEQTESELADIRDAKEKAESEKAKLAKDTEKKVSEMDKTKKAMDKLKADLEEAEKATESVKSQLAEITERAEKAESQLAEKAAEALRIAADAEAALEVAQAKIDEVTQEEVVLQDVIKAKEKLATKGKVWSTGLCSCCAKPGGIGLCMKGFCCPCLVLGRMNAMLKLDGTPACPGGCFGGCCLGCCCLPCYMRKAAPAVATAGGREEGKCKACCCGMCCPCCYVTQVQREMLINAEGGGSKVSEAPLQESMGEGGDAAKAATAEKAPKEKGAKLWSTGLCKCCAKPGGCGLCVKAFCCPCLLTRAFNGHLKDSGTPGCPGGKCGGCVCGCCCMPCFLRKAAPLVVAEQSKCKACMKGCCCPCCFLEQVWREVLISKEE